MHLFPTLLPENWGYLNLNDEAQKSIAQNYNLDFTNPNSCNAWIEKLHREKGIKYSYGGFLEERSTLWKEHYQKETGAFVHLGVDYNVPANTFVTLPCDGVVVDVMHDKDQFGGWGGRIMWKLQTSNALSLSSSSLYLIYGHLGQPIFPEVGKQYRKGEIVGRIGESFENGGWHPHLHVQVMDEEFIKYFSYLKSIDGYLPQGHVLLSHIYDPERVFRV